MRWRKNRLSSVQKRSKGNSNFRSRLWKSPETPLSHSSSTSRERNLGAIRPSHISSTIKLCNPRCQGKGVQRVEGIGQQNKVSSLFDQRDSVTRSRMAWKEESGRGI